MLKKILIVLLAALMGIAPSVLHAARVTPMIVELEPTGGRSVARIELSNPGQNDFPVEVQMYRGAITEEGELQLTPADEEFLLFPAQIVIPSASQQVFRVQYIGEPELAKSEVFYMKIKQIPLPIPANQSKVQVVVNFNVLINVVPDGVSPEPFVESIQSAEREGVPGIEVRVSNQGTRFFLAGTLPWEISGVTQSGETFEERRTPDEMASAIGVGVVAPDRARIFFVPLEQPLVEESIKVELIQ